ncbi:MAG: GatB/YqeY domain-containing protein [Chromatiaceae bacterium]|nr:GatB/YqeY domain-containing protein [Gammaproteobacteria bacterium]MCP5448496.1 GatB/YqeY domain-containing protein [Chromatiaceae bacterium]MCB1862247.1 GatB/YqeY domain-containing protein [Gammaproteobacteria bacterium]MCB1872899.1 GatB/YqeY domain-containing protein [Gammaproteobacteria bacterium]MCB1882156.1 GatB/YqeY domain-containing protein [Gammaproteobacteria bacterium]
MLKTRIKDEMVAAMKAGDKRRLGTIRLLLAAIKQREVDERIELDDTQVLVVLDKMVKQRKDSIEQYEKAGRTDLAEQESFEISVLQEYLPAALSDDEIDTLIDETISNTGATSIKEMGKVMGEIKPKAQGRADMGKISAKIRARLTS